jgi:hypothetical protein
MRRYGIIAVISGVAVMVGAIGTATAGAALPEILSAGGVTVKYTSLAGETSFETASGTKVVCKSLTNSGETGAKTGFVTLDFDECEIPALKLKCESPGDNVGVILIKPNTELVFTKKIGTLEAGILFTPAAGETLVTIECTALVKIVILKGPVCPISPINVITKTEVISCLQEKGKQKPQNYTNDKAEEKSTQMLASTNGGAYENVGMLTSDTVTTNVLIEIMA